MTQPSRHAGRRILVSWYTDPSYIPPFRLSENQYTVGPQIGAVSTGVFNAFTPRGAYDLKAAVEGQGGPAGFELVVVAVDSGLSNLPGNLKAFGCPTLLCAGDTHHLEIPLQKMLTYALQGGFDFVVSMYDRHHLHWYVEATTAKAAWIPALEVRHMPRPLDLVRQARLAFVGQLGRYHPRRKRLLEEVQRQQLPLIAGGGTRPYAADLYASSVLSFNASLNGDLNLRVFEILSAGGCVLTDRLGSESGQSAMLDEDLEILCYDSAEELLDKIRYYLAHPEAALAVACRGHEAYVKRLHPARQAEVLLDWIFDGQLDWIYRPDWDRRPAFVALDPERPPISNRVQLYEMVQEKHCQQERVRIAFDARVPSAYIADALDLHRCEIAIVGSGGDTRRKLQTLGLGRPVEELSMEAATGSAWDIVVAKQGFALPARLLVQA